MISHGSDLVVGPRQNPLFVLEVSSDPDGMAGHHRDAISGFVKVLLRWRLWTGTGKSFYTLWTDPSLPVPSTLVKPTVRDNCSGRRVSGLRRGDGE